eukprot:89934_1
MRPFINRSIKSVFQRIYSTNTSQAYASSYFWQQYISLDIYTCRTRHDENEYHDENNYRSKWRTKYNDIPFNVCLAGPPVVGAMARTGNADSDDDKDEHNEPNEKAMKKKAMKKKNPFCGGNYTFLQDDIDDIIAFLHSKEDKNRRYPRTATTMHDKRNFRSFIGRHLFTIKQHTAHNVQREYLYKTTTVAMSKKSGNRVNLKSKKSEITANEVERFTKTVRVAAERELPMIWNKLHVNKQHPGENATVELIGASYYVVRMVKYVQETRNECNTCIEKHNNNKKKRRAPLTLIPAPREPMTEFQIDLCGPFHKGICGENYCLIVKDLVTRWTKPIFIISKTAPAVADALHSRVTLAVGGAKRYHSDNGSEFVNTLDEYCSHAYGYRRTAIVPGNPWENGGAESGVKQFKNVMNQLLEQHCKEEGKVFNRKKWNPIWSTLEAEAFYLLNVKPNSITGISPFAYAYNKTIYPDYIAEQEDTHSSSILSPAQLIKAHKSRYVKVDSVVRARMQHRRNNIKRSWDKSNATDKIAIGTHVKYHERGQWLPKDGAVYLHSYTSTDKCRLYDNLAHHVITVPLNKLKEALKSEHLITTHHDKSKRGQKSYVHQHHRYNSTTNSSNSKQKDNICEQVCEQMCIDEEDDKEDDKENVIAEPGNDTLHTMDNVENVGTRLQSLSMTPQASHIERKRKRKRKEFDDDVTNAHGIKKRRLNNNETYESKVTCNINTEREKEKHNVNQDHTVHLRKTNKITKTFKSKRKRG